MLQILVFCTVVSMISRVALAHSAFWHPSMWGFNVTDKTFSYDNRPVAPLRNKSFKQWWFHNHLAYPPNPGDIFELPAGGNATAEIACTKDATSFWNIAPDGGRNIQDSNNVCPNSPSLAYHTNGINDLMGCALAIAYKNNVDGVKPEDFTIFSVNQTCVWTRFTDFQVPQRMPACPQGGCICSFFWVHSPKAGGEENYMNGFRCNVTNVTSTVPLAKPAIPRRCGSDPENNKQFSAPQNCTYGAKQPFYWLNDDSNMFEGDHAPPVYNDLYNFADGPQKDIFEDSYVQKPTSDVVAALPVFGNIQRQVAKRSLSRKIPVIWKPRADGRVDANLDDTAQDSSNPPTPTLLSVTTSKSSLVAFERLASDSDGDIVEGLDPRLLRRYVRPSFLQGL